MSLKGSNRKNLKLKNKLNPINYFKQEISM